MFASRLRRYGLLGIVAVCVGCSSRANMEALEAHIRNQESLLSQYENRLKRMEGDLSVAEREADILRSQLADNQGQQLFQETTQALAAVEGVKFHELLTAGQDDDDQPGDERLHAVIYPHDQHGKLVKLSGTLSLEAIDLSLPHDQRVVGKWEFTPDEARELWHSGFLTNGYQLDLPWMRTPQGEKVLLHAQLRTPDGREFDATHTVAIAVPPLAKVEQPHDLLVPPVQQAAGIQQISAETDASKSRPVPRPAPLEPAAMNGEEFSTPMTSDRSNEPGRIQLPDQTAELPIEAKKASTPRPFPNGLRTSDNWTDATIPILR